ncbi:hypothetical protein MPSEU_000878400 [Mayamaea pseudoterrestris]|nr:hypothetical protein MPSEU_000878400 [Mayamaea pseudoterrestris]
MLYETPPPIASKQSHRNKKTKKELMVEEISILALSKPPWEYRDEATGIRVPPCTTRVLRCHAKPNWNDQPLLKVLQAEFIDFSRPEELEKILHFKLLRVNGKSLDATDATTFRLKSGDLLSRILHWHEAPVIVPARIDIQRVTLPSTIVSDYQLNKNSAVYVCDKPSSVPVHPAGPYFSNTLTLMLEAQENLQPASLIPLHRTDRVTSGLTLLCNDPKISRIFHLSFSKTGFVRKLYIAKVKGRFNVAAKGVDTLFENKNIGEYRWDEACETVEVLAPVETVDPANGLRAITSRGKPARSVFRLIHYESSEDASYLACYPISGRNHQLRVHLSWLGYPIIGDVQYGGVSQG